MNDSHKLLLAKGVVAGGASGCVRANVRSAGAVAEAVVGTVDSFKSVIAHSGVGDEEKPDLLFGKDLQARVTVVSGLLSAGENKVPWAVV